MALKQCSKCGQEKDVALFHRDKNKKSGLRSACKICLSEQDRKKHSHTYTLKKRPTCSACDTVIGHNNQKKMCRTCQKKVFAKHNSERASSYAKNNRSKINERLRFKYQNDNRFKMKAILRSRLNSAVKKGVKSGSAVSDLGCSIEYLKKYLEVKFEYGMTWDNWGKGEGYWHIDHIIPLASFDLADPEQLKKACHYTNLQPMWEKENLQKGAKLWL